MKKKHAGRRQNNSISSSMHAANGRGRRNKNKAKTKYKYDFLRTTKKSALLKMERRHTRALGIEMTITPD